MERPKRQKTGSSGKSMAFEKLKQLKSGGGKHKIDITPMENVYEEVTEDEYTENVLKRQQDDWIVDDYGAEGYVEDGREIFDDDLDEESIQKDRKSKKRDHSGAHKKLEPPKGNIQKMLANMPAKKKKVMTGKDDILEELMGNLDEEYSSKISKPAPVRTYGSKTTTKIPSNDDFRRLQSSSNESFANTCAKNQSDEIFDSIIAKTPSKSDVKGVTVSSTSTRSENTSKESVSSANVPLIEKEAEAEIFEFPEDDFELPNTEIPSNFSSSSVNLETSMKRDSAHFDGNAPSINLDNSGLPVIENGAVKNNSSEFVGIKTPLKSTLPDTLASWSPCTNENAPAVNIDCSKLPLIEKEDGTKVFRFFYWDAYEEAFNKAGQIYLFGKVCVEGSEYASCCISVRNIERRIYLLPREKKFDFAKKQETDSPVSMRDVYDEWNNKIAEKHRITTFKSIQKNKNYAFNLADVPDTSDYLEVRYGAEFPAMRSDLVGETFSHIFGTNTSFLEIFLIERKIKGPCWLEIVEPAPSNPLASWCKFEVTCNDMSKISVVRDGGPPPPLVVVTLNLRITPIPPKSVDNQITMISCLVQNKYHADKEAPSKPFEHHFCAFTKPEKSTWPYDNKESLDNYKATKLDKVNSERGLLGLFLAKFHKIDPDLIVGHDICGFDIGTLVHRLVQNKVMNWSRLGRLRRSTAPQFGKGRNYAEKNILCGRLLCDISISARELIKAKSYDLDTICQQVLNIPEGARKDLNSEEVRAMYQTSSSLLKLIELTMLDASYILRIMYKLNVIPLSLQITNIAGNVLSRTLMGGRAERNEFLLLHAFNDKNYIVPDKTYGKKGAKQNDVDGVAEPNVGKGKRKPQYEGGLVLEPKKGFYDKYILLMDFNSLYPSIIQEYNICFTTVSVRGIDIDEGDIEVLMNHLPSASQPGILPTEIRKLVESRRAVKALMAKHDISPDLKHQYDIRQLALKLTANSMYGCLGFPNSRFYAKPLAAMVTAKGRDILVNTKDLVQKLNFDVIYGDTDSLMINTNSTDFEEVFKVGHKIKAEVNKLYKQIELDIDGVFKYMLLLKKKKYAAVTVSKINDKLVSKQEIKGLDVVRRDWSPLSSNAGRYVLNQLLCDQNLEDKLENIHSNLRRIKTELEQNTVPINELAITKQLTKNPEDYPDKKSLPHVQVALRMNQHLTKKFKQGDSIFYVVCEDGTTNAATQRAYHVDELKNNPNLKIDVKYYLSQQVHPVVTRLVEPIEGIDAAQIAESLGLDSSSYIKRIDTIIEENDEMVIDETDKFKNCEKFEFACTACGKLNVIESPVVKQDGEYFPALDNCTNPSCNRNPVKEDVQFLQNKLLLTIRSFIHKYYQDWMICEEPTCGYRTRVISNLNRQFLPLCPACANKNVLLREYNESQLHNQLSYFEHLFDVEFILQKIKNNRDAVKNLEKDNYCKLKNVVSELLLCNAYNIIDFGEICRQMLMK